MDCIFCKIASHELPTDKPPLYEDDEVIVVYDKFPKAPVHVLFIPKRHIASVLDTDESDRALLGKIVSLIAKTARDLGVSDFKIVSNNGKYQELKHLHFHLASGPDLKVANI